MGKYSTEKKQEARREEIVDACEKLYQTMSFKDITMKEISTETSFTRPSIYNYFHTKEEIFLALLQREYVKWEEDLRKVIDSDENLTAEGFADAVARSLENRGQLLKLLAMNHYDMEENSRSERLTEFKVSFGKVFATFTALVKKYFPNMSEEKLSGFLYAFFPFMFGIYPYTHVTEKQMQAMTAAGMNFVPQSVYNMVYTFLMKTIK